MTTSMTWYLYQSQAPLKHYEKHCYYCSGYGVKPNVSNDSIKHVRCFKCEGTGKMLKECSTLIL